MKRIISLLLSVTMLLSVIAGVDLSALAKTDWFAIASSDFSAVDKAVSNGSLGEVPTYKGQGNPISWSTVAWTGNGNVEKESDALYIPDGYMYMSGYAANSNSGLPIKGYKTFKIDFEFRYKDAYIGGEHSSDNANYSGGYTFMKIGSYGNVLSDCASDMYENALFTQDAFGPCGTSAYQWYDGKPVSTFGNNITAGEDYHYILEYTTRYARAYVTDSDGTVLQEEFYTSDYNIIQQIGGMLNEASYMKIGDNRQTAYLRALEYKNITFYTTEQASPQLDGDTYLINDLSEFEAFSDSINSGNSYEGKKVRLTADITMNDADVFEYDENGFAVDIAKGKRPYVWLPIGNPNNPFKGSFDGGGHEINGIYIDSSAGHQGLFGYCVNADVKNITTNYGLITNGTYAGGIIGYNLDDSDNSTISNCINKATIKIRSESSWNYCSGGIIGLNENKGAVTNISDCKNYAPAIVEFNNSFSSNNSSYRFIGKNGGIVGDINTESGKVAITNCSNAGEIKVTFKQNITNSSDEWAFIGGIVGYSYKNNSSDVSVSYCENNAKLFSEGCRNNIGGIVGKSEGMLSVSDCNNSGDINGYYAIGGIIGDGSCDITRCYNSASIKASSDNVGGIAGNYYNGGMITNCYNTGNVEGNQYAGGIAGYNSNDVNNCYNSGEVKGHNKVGGIVGRNIRGSISCCYNGGTISGDSLLRAIAADNNGEGFNKYSHIDDCYYYEATAFDGIQNGQYGRSNNIVSLTYEEMQSPEKFDKFDFENIWGFATTADDYCFPILLDMMYTYTIINEGREFNISVIDENDLPITSGVSVNWYEKGSDKIIGKGNKFSVSDDEKEYQYRVVLNEELSYIYIQPEISDAPMKEINNNIIVRLVKFDNTVVTGKVVDSNKDSVGNASIVFKQTFNDKYVKTSACSTDENGSFSIKLANVPTVAEISAKGYYSRTRTVIDTTAEEKVDLENITLTKLPENRITLSIFKSNAVQLGQDSLHIKLDSISGLEFSLFNKSTNTPINGFTVQYPNIILDDGQAQAGDTILINAVDKNNEMTAEQTAVELDEQNLASCNIELIENGKFSVSKITGNNANTLILFDSNDKYVYSEDVGNTYISKSLAAGNYKAVFIKKNSILKSVSDIKRLPALGLSVNTDFVVKDVIINNGEIRSIGEVDVPDLNEEKLSYTVSENTKVTVNTSSARVGKYIIVKCEYKIQNKYSSENEVVTVELPEDTEFTKGSLTLDGKTTQYSIDENNTLSVHTAEREGVIRFYVVASKVGKKNINAYLSFENDGEQVLQYLGSAAFNAKAEKINIPKKTGLKTLTVSGSTLANSSVTLYDNDIEVGTVKSNANGTWSLKFELVKPYNYSYHEIYSVTNNDKISNPIISEKEKLIFDENYIVVSKVTMINTAHVEKVQEFSTVFDFINPSVSVPSYRYWQSYPKFTFKAEFAEGDSSSLSNVFVVTTNGEGEKTNVPMTYDKTSGLWVGTHNYYKESDAPVYINVVYDCNSEDILLSSEMLDDTYNEIMSELEKINDDTSIDTEPLEELGEIVDIVQDYEESSIFHTDKYKEYEAYFMNESGEPDQEKYEEFRQFLMDDDETKYNEFVDKISAYTTDDNDVDEEIELEFENLSELEDSLIDIEELQEYLELKTTVDYKEDNVLSVFNESIGKGLNIQVLDCSELSEDSLVSEGYTKVETTDGRGVYYKSDDKTREYIDFKNNQYIILEDNIIDSELMSVFAALGNADKKEIKKLAEDDDFVKRITELVEDCESNFERVKQYLEFLYNYAENIVKNFESQIKALQKIINEAECGGTANSLHNLTRKRQLLVKELVIREYTGNTNVAPILKKINEIDARISKVTKDIARYKSQLSRLTKQYEAAAKALKALSWIGKALPILDFLFTVVDFLAIIRDTMVLFHKLNLIEPECPEASDKLIQLLEALKTNSIYAATIYSTQLAAAAVEVLTAFGLIAAAPATAGTSLLGTIGLIAMQIIKVVGLAYINDHLEKEINSIDYQADHVNDLCKPDEPDPYVPGDNSPGSPMNIIKDPSGYVYEAVPSNRLEGVKAEAYYYDYALDEFGVPEETKSDILWDAENYDQVNPLYTDANGEYAWDVPLGQWLVKFSKEGYYDTDSRNDPAVDEEGYLPVPPPQTEVNVGMVSKAAPKVDEVTVYNDEIRIVFSQYMKLSSVNTNNVTVTMNGIPVSGTITPLNAEYDYEQVNQYASKFKFVPNSSISGAIGVTVKNVINYAGTKSKEVFNNTYKVTPKPESISVNDEITVTYNSGALLEVSVLPAEAGAGKTLDVSTSSPSIAGIVNENVVLDENGKANIMLSGNLPGDSEITISLAGTDLTKTVKASVSDIVEVKNQCEKVTANIKSGKTVEKGTRIELSTPTEGAEIYYTLDGTCPCTVNSPSRTKYTGPIEINEETFIIAYAVKDGMEESYTAGFTYFIKHEHTPAEAIRENENPSTYDKEGSYESVVYCSECGEEISRETVKLAKLKKTSLAKATVTGIVNKTYTGSAITQKLSVKLGNAMLKNGTDYKVTYKNNKSVGTATVTITGVKKYSGTIKKTFRINPKATTLTKATAGKKSFTLKWNKQTTQTTGYEIQYATNSNFTSSKKSVLVTKNSTASKKISKLKAKKKYYVRIRTYKTVSGKKYYSSWSKPKTVTTK